MGVEGVLGVYVHIPYCLRKCGYCDFFSVPTGRQGIPHEAYLAAIARQLAGDVSPLAGRRISSVYFGGGTPSLMPPEFFAEVLALLGRRFVLDADAEVSCEVNPATADAAWFRAAREAGITRCSIGVQSFQPRLLSALGRLHSAEEAMRAIAEAQEAGFESVNIDLMYAIPGESVVELEDDLRTAMAFQPQHISAYELTVEEHEPPLTFFLSPPATKTSAGREGRGNSAPSPPRGEGLGEGEQLNQMRTVARTLERGGWARYEISNFAKPGHECRHNLNCWRYGEWLGLGAGATSFVRWRRWTQVRDVEKYLAGSSELAEEETIDTETAMGEFCFLALRTMEGILPERFEAIFGESFEARYGDVSGGLIRDGLLERAGRRFALTPRGLEMANTASARFVGEPPLPTQGKSRTINR